MKLLQQALEALESLFSGESDPLRPLKINNAILALRTAIEQAEQAQPVGLMTVDKDARAYSLLQYEAFADLPSGKHEIYTRPAAPVKPLSLDAINEWSQRRIRAAGGIEGVTNIPSIMEEAVRFAEAAHGIKERK